MVCVCVCRGLESNGSQSVNTRNPTQVEGEDEGGGKEKCGPLSRPVPSIPYCLPSMETVEAL